jgi:glyceraldehyde-3-phosphate dehydrogenase type I
VVLECTGFFRAKKEAARHLQAGADKVIIGAAPFDEVDATIVYGINHMQLTHEQKIISSVSCTTHALVPMMKILDEAFGIQSALMTEIHAVTSDQVLLDHTHGTYGAVERQVITSSPPHRVVLAHLSGCCLIWRIKLQGIRYVCRL